MNKIGLKSLSRLHPCNLALVYRYFSKVIGGNRALAHFLAYYVKPCPGDRLLDVGCGPGRLAENLPPGVDYVGIDSNELDISWARQKFQGMNGRDFRCCRLEEISAAESGFDIILMSGLLHHLSDPEHGWRVLLTLLRPGGFMNIGLYSELARQNVVGAREFIARRGYGHTVEDIRACRQAIITIQGDAPWRSVLRWTDFYSTSACRDLIFHVQEHRFTIPRIKAFLTNNGLAFIGFNIDPRTLARYRKRFLDDPAAVNLDFWDVFEHENPDTFSGMYQFCVQKP